MTARRLGRKVAESSIAERRSPAILFAVADLTPGSPTSAGGVAGTTDIASMTAVGA
jgi:hypothetical protein